MRLDECPDPGLYYLMYTRCSRASDVHKNLARELGGVGLGGSVTEEADLRTLVDKTLDAYGRVDAVVNGTGHAPMGHDDVLDITDEEWHAGLDLIMLNVVRMARLVTPVMLRQDEGGAMVNISTSFAFEPSAIFPVSSSLRSALAGFTKLYAERYAAEGHPDEQPATGLHRDLLRGG